MYSVYLITNQLNEKIYVGQTRNKLKKRFKQHLLDASRGKPCHLHHALRQHKYFTITLITTKSTRQESNEAEMFWIKRLSSHDPNIGYNMTAGGDGARHLREDSRRRISEAAAMRWSKPENTPLYRSEVSTAEIVEKYQSGLSSDEVANIMGLHGTLVCARLHKAGVKIRGKRIDIDMPKAKQMYEQGFTAVEIGKVMGGLNKTSVLKKLRKFGVVMRRSGARTKESKKETARVSSALTC